MKVTPKVTFFFYIFAANYYPMRFSHIYIISLLSLFFLSHLPVFGQIDGLVVEKGSRLPIAFATIVYQRGEEQKGVVSDIYGKFEIKEVGVSRFAVSYMGYKTKEIDLSKGRWGEKLVIELEISTEELKEAVITPAENPALRIIRNVLNHKKSNNFLNYEDYSHRAYIKTILDMKVSADASSLDSNRVKILENIRKQAGFISECVMWCYKSGNRERNKIIAHKTSGFKDPMFVQAFSSLFHNSISFYENSVSLFRIPTLEDLSKTEYISPLSDEALSLYNFRLEESIIEDAEGKSERDTTFIINFYPRKGKIFSSLKGKLLISSDKYALKNIVVEPAGDALLRFKFRQDYELVEGRWFPTRLDEEVVWGSQTSGNDFSISPTYLIAATIDSVSYASTSPVGDRGLEKVFVDYHSIKLSDSIMTLARPDTLTVRELRTFNLLDSIGQKHNFDRKIKALPKLANGRLPFYCFDIDLQRIYRANDFEGNRVGFGLYTNDRILNNFSVGGYVGYGFRDKKYKYGGDLIIDINKYHEIRLKFFYRSDLKEAGIETSNEYGSLFNSYLRSYIGNRYDSFVEKGVDFSFRPFPYFKVHTSLRMRDLRPNYTYLYKGSQLNDYRSDELQLNIGYAHGEELSTWGTQRMVNYEGNPKVTLSYRKGVNLFDREGLSYNKLEGAIDYIAYNGRIGETRLRLEGGFIDKPLPYNLLFTGEGSKNSDISLILDNSFQTLSPYEFLSDRYVNLFFTHNFGSLFFTSKYFNPQFLVVHNIGWGDLKNPSFHVIDFKTKERVFLESGLIVNSILRIPIMDMYYIGFGVGGFYRYGYYRNDSFKENSALKLSVNISF